MNSTPAASTHSWSEVRPLTSVASWITAILGFTALSIGLTWPWTQQLWDGTVGGDAAQFVWDAWWVAERVANLEDPWRTELLYAPEGTYLGAHPLETLLMALISPLTAATGPTITFGLLLLGTLTASGVAAWRLARVVGLGAVESLVAGVLWESSPIVVHHTASGLYMLLLLAAVLPAAALLTVRLVDGFSRRRSLALGAFLGACLLTDLQVTAYTVLVVAAILAYAAATRPRWRTKEALVCVALTGATLLAIGSPVLAMVARSESAGDYRTTKSARVTSATEWNADAAQFLLPSPASRYFGDDYRRAAEELGDLSRFPIDSTVALGWATLLLAGVGVVATRRSARTWWLVGAVLACGVLAIGPNLKAFGHTHTPLAVDVGRDVSLLTPATWLLGVPVVNDLRIPARYMQLGALALVVLAAVGAGAVLRRQRPIGASVVAGLCALAVAEGAVPLHALPPAGERLAAIIRDDRRAGVVVDVPLSWRSGIELVGSPFLSPRAMVQQTIHEKPIAAGYIARLDPAMLDRLLERPLYRSLLLRQKDGDVPAGLEMPVDGEVIADARQLRANWVVVWPEADPQVKPYLVTIGYRLRAEDDGAALYIR